MACLEYADCDPYVGIAANPDVGGSGIVVAFLLSAWSALLLVLWVFIFSDAFPDDKKNNLDSDITGSIKKLAEYTARPLKRFKRSVPREIVQKVALTLSDAQLISGTSIFIAAFANTCTISQYHFKIAYFLGASSFLTHQLTVMIIRDLLRDRPLMRAWRLLWVLAIFAFVFSANMIVYNIAFRDDIGSPVQCALLFNNQFSNRPDPRFDNGLLAVTSIFWAWGLVAVVRDLCPELKDFLSNLLDPFLSRLKKVFNLLSGRQLYLWTMEKTSAAQPGSASHHALWLLDKVFFIPFLLCFTVTEILTSSMIDLYRVLTSLISLTCGIWFLKTGWNSIEEDNRWAFGQIMSMLLLALPLFQALDLVYDTLCTSIENKGPARPRHPQSVETPANPTARPHQVPSQVPTGRNSDDSNAVERASALSTAQPDPSTPPLDSSRLRHVDTEMGRSPANRPNKYPKARSTPLEKRLYSSRVFRLWMVFWVLFLVGLTCGIFFEYRIIL